MVMTDKMEKCLNFFNELAENLKDYEMIGSCNKDYSVYLIPKGTIDKLSYYEKPKLSFRLSDHWNWYSNLEKCHHERYVQCYSVDIPWARRRREYGKATKPIYGVQVAIYGTDNKYHCVYGDKFDRKTREWSWKEQSVKDVIEKMIKQT